MVVCPDCISSGIWKQDFSESKVVCDVCGPHRTITFSQRDYVKTTVDQRVCTETPLETFVDWILHDLNAVYETMAYSHFGGRYFALIIIICY
jgi:hypothetical protein